MNRNERIYSVFITVFFILLISVAVFNKQLQFSEYRTISTFEKRKLAERPAMNLEKLDPYPPLYTEFFNDHFPFRPELIKDYTWFNYFVLDKSPKPDYVMIGKNHWLYLVPREKTLYTGYPTVSDSGIRNIGKYLDERTKWHLERGIRFYVAFAPMKPEIYPEYNPPSFLRAEKTVTDKITGEIRKYPDIRFIELKPALLEAKKNARIYWARDNHWNSIGAFAAYREIMKSIRQDFPNARFIPEKEVSFRDTVVHYGLTEVFNLGEELGDTIYHPTISNSHAKKIQDEVYFWDPPEGCWKTVTETAVSDRPKALIFRDSFTNFMMPFLDESFSKTVYIFDKWNYDYHREVVENVKPDLVILLIYEPLLYNLADLK